jgi:hypothetical protein
MRKKALDVPLQPKEQVHVLLDSQRGLGSLQEANAVILAAVFQNPRLFLFVIFAHTLPSGPNRAWPR